MWILFILLQSGFWIIEPDFVSEKTCERTRLALEVMVIEDSEKYQKPIKSFCQFHPEEFNVLFRNPIKTKEEGLEP